MEPALELESAFVEMVKDYQEHGEKVPFFVDADPVLEFSKAIHLLKQHALGKELPHGFSAYKTYWLVRNKKNIIGNVRLRLELTPFLKEQGGHIGFDIRPSERKKGYGTHILALALEKTRELGMSRILVTAASDNSASRKIIVSNGGQLENEIFSNFIGKPVSRYWIVIQPEIGDGI